MSLACYFRWGRFVTLSEKILKIEPNEIELDIVQNILDNKEVSSLAMAISEN